MPPSPSSFTHGPPQHYHNPVPSSPRWDSFAQSAHSPIPSPASSRFPYYPPDSHFDSHGHHQPVRSDSRQGYDHQHRPLMAKSSLNDLRSQDANFVGNFSRPRTRSLRQPPQEPLKLRPSNLTPVSDKYYDPSHEPPVSPAWRRPRGPSDASYMSSSNYGSAYQPPIGDPNDPRFGRMRNATHPHPQAPRIPFANQRMDNSTPSPGIGSAPWAEDENRSSFRSHNTMSTGPDTLATERSSVMTKDTSMTSLDTSHEPSLEDLMGMYEKGFDDDEEQEEDPDRAEGRRQPSRAPSSLTTESPVRRPNAHSALDNEIRQSKMIFTSLAFTSSVPHIASKYEANHDDDDDDDDEKAKDKRDSGKSIDSDPSLKSYPVTNNGPARTEISPSPPPPAMPAPAPAPAPTPLPEAEPEEPGSRDRYGFKKANQYVTRQQYDSWDKGYSEYIARRRKKWTSYMKDCSLMTDRPTRFPAPNAKTRRFVRKGIPPDWRGAAWFYYAGGPAILAKHSGLYDKLLQRRARQVDRDAIERDLHRTFPDNVKFKPPAGHDQSSDSERSSTLRYSSGSSFLGPAGAEGEPSIISALRRVLHAFAVYNPRIGYCQSLNFLAGLLLLFVETEEQCFWLLNVITCIYLPGTHDTSLEGSKVDLGVLMTEIRDTMPGVWDKIGGDLEADPVPMGRPQTNRSLRKAKPTRSRGKDQKGLSTERLPPITLCMTAWFMSCFIGTLPIETTLRVWDVFFYEGSKTLFRIALAIFKSGESEIKRVTDPMEMFGVVQAMPRRMIDANALMEACFKRRNGFGHLSQADVDDRRAQRREQARQELESKMAQANNTTEAEGDLEARRGGGTLFGRKNRDRSKTRTSDA
ncbi:hypothetical protein B0I35DRAFT_358433 [Stachybotrys elegans]|uniref:Rab-GAP TBC domain-containing protein n=1 Tax=Stachybotrys elegans TaxID=80388 RepID=A0A8K0SNB4_9HYPO|nr:hypothetical protein B0I35DRAFT_358433 [Stachybotrys elegans]